MYKRQAVDDRLHQPYRMKLIEHSEEIFQRAYELGAYAVYVSGAWPTMMAIVDGKDNSFASSRRAYLGGLSLDGWEIRELSVDNEGTIIESLK